MSTATILLITASFLASAVEMVEALTIVLAVSLTRGWKIALLGAGAGLALAPRHGVAGPEPGDEEQADEEKGHEARDRFHQVVDCVDMTRPAIDDEKETAVRHCRLRMRVDCASRTPCEA